MTDRDMAVTVIRMLACGITEARTLLHLMYRTPKIPSYFLTSFHCTHDYYANLLNTDLHERHVRF